MDKQTFLQSSKGDLYKLRVLMKYCKDEKLQEIYKKRESELEQKVKELETIS